MIAPRSRTVFVLTGGANVGAVQVGMLRGLFEAGIVPDALVGCSVGAINAAAVAVDPGSEQLDRLEAVWRRLRREDIFPSTKWHQAWQVARGRTNLHRADALRATIGRWLSIQDLSEAAVPVHVVTTDLATGAARWWSSGPAVDVLAASCCLPGVFPPVPLDGGLHVDGGVVQNVPIGRAAQLGARSVVVLDATTWQWSAEPPRSALGVFLHAARISRQAHLRHDLAALPRAVEVLWLALEEPVRLAYDDFSQTGRLIEAGYALTCERIAGRTGPRRRLRRHRETAGMAAQPLPSVAS